MGVMGLRRQRQHRALAPHARPVVDRRAVAATLAAAGVGIALITAGDSGAAGHQSPPTRTGAAASTTTSTPTTASRPSDRPDVRDNEILVRFRSTGHLQRIRVAPGQDPVALARQLRRHTKLFKTVGANLIATAAGAPKASAAQATTAATTTPATPVPTLPPATPSPATPTFSVPASASIPPPKGLAGWLPTDHIGPINWAALQWNFVGPYGIDAPQAWATLRTRSPQLAGGATVKIAVIDSGIAYRDSGIFRRSPDVDTLRLLPGYDFVDLDRYPDDISGHGTHVAATIAASTDDGVGLTGLAYRAEILPIRVLDYDPKAKSDSGDVLTIARGIRYAIRRKVDLINLSIDFELGRNSADDTTAADIPEVMSALDAARRAGILVIASSGNDGYDRVAYPARAASVMAVGATTANGCRSTYSNAGPELALVAPGGGRDHAKEVGPLCRPKRSGPPIAQVTLMKPLQTMNLGVPLDFQGTSMAAAHVTGIAALVLGSEIIGRHPSPELLSAYLVRTTRDLGKKGRDTHYGAGLINAQEAVSRKGLRVNLRSARRAVNAAKRKHQDGLPIR
jgi:serine protease